MKHVLLSEKNMLFFSIMLLSCNFIDAVVSWYMIIYLGVATEINPFMDWLMNHGTEWFLSYKIFVMPVLVFILYKNRKYFHSKLSLLLLSILYMSLIIYSGVLLVWFFTIET